MKEAKLWKRVLFEGVAKTTACDDQLNEESLNSDIIKSPIITTTLTPESRRIGEPFDWDKYKYLSMPFPKFFVEWSMQGSADDSLLLGTMVYANPAVTDDSASPKFIPVSMQFIQANKSHRPGAFARADIALDENRSVILGSDAGTPMLKTSIDHLGREFWFGAGYKSSSEGIAKHILTPLELTLDLITYLSCKNVQLEQVDPDPKTARVATKRHGESKTGYRYHILTVRPPGSKPGTKGEPIGDMPRHVCRGHFSEYGPQFGKGKLFGKLEGRFFIPPHMRGKAENGIVEKDYRV